VVKFYRMQQFLIQIIGERKSYITYCYIDRLNIFPTSTTVKVKSAGAGTNDPNSPSIQISEVENTFMGAHSPMVETDRSKLMPYDMPDQLMSNTHFGPIGIEDNFWAKEKLGIENNQVGYNDLILKFESSDLFYFFPIKMKELVPVNDGAFSRPIYLKKAENFLLGWTPSNLTSNMSDVCKFFGYDENWNDRIVGVWVSRLGSGIFISKRVYRHKSFQIHFRYRDHKGNSDIYSYYDDPQVLPWISELISDTEVYSLPYTDLIANAMPLAPDQDTAIMDAYVNGPVWGTDANKSYTLLRHKMMVQQMGNKSSHEFHLQAWTALTDSLPAHILCIRIDTASSMAWTSYTRDTSDGKTMSETGTAVVHPNIGPTDSSNTDFYLSLPDMGSGWPKKVFQLSTVALRGISAIPNNNALYIHDSNGIIIGWTFPHNSDTSDRDSAWCLYGQILKQKKCAQGSFYNRTTHGSTGWWIARR
jgi:hypothetical protein